MKTFLEHLNEANTDQMEVASQVFGRAAQALDDQGDEDDAELVQHIGQILSRHDLPAALSYWNNQVDTYVREKIANEVESDEEKNALADLFDLIDLM